MKEYRHSWQVHLIFWVWTIVFGSCAVLAFLKVRGESLLHFALLFSLMVLGVLWLYVVEGRAVWRVLDEGLEVRNPLGKRVLKWTDIKEVRHKAAWRMVQVRGDRKILCIISSDSLPRFQDLLAEIENRMRRSDR